MLDIAKVSSSESFSFRREADTPSDSDLSTFLSRPVRWGPIGEEVFKRTYSQDKEDGGKETWAETVVRVVDGNLGLVDARHHEPGEREALIKLLFDMGALPAGRHLSASGRIGRQFLFNCLRGDTLVHTKEGMKSIRELAGKKVEVLTRGEREKLPSNRWACGQGVWRTATFQSFGSQELFEVEFSDGTTVYATEDHKWYTTTRSGPVETKKLVGLAVPYILPVKPEKDAAYDKGVLHGFVYGDGSVSQNNDKTYSAHVLMFNDKDLALVPLFQRAGYEVTTPHYCKAYVGRLPAEWKELPDDGASLSYWRGFIAGLLAADGTVTKNGGVTLYHANKEALEVVRRKAMEVGFVTTPLYLQRETNPWTGEEAALWRFMFRRFSVDPSDLLLQEHRARFEDNESIISSVTCTAVRPTGMTEEVFCAIEPETQTFVIDNNLLTGNCHNSHYDPNEPSAHFTFLFDQLMQGGGVGANYSNRYMDLQPIVKRMVHLHVVCDQDHPNIGEFDHMLSKHDGLKPDHEFIVPDSREGWVDAVGVILRLAFGEDAGFTEIDPHSEEVTLTINVSHIRPRGRPLKTSGGIACGPGPLVETLVAIAKRINVCHGRRLRSLDTMALDHDLAACVIAGGKRRSSRMSVKNWKDDDIFEFIYCKAQDGLHWSTNISVETDDEFLEAYENKKHPLHNHARRVARAVTQGKRENGEPGLWNISLSRQNDPDVVSPNPCGEIGLNPWENCNLGHVNMEYFAPNPTGYQPIMAMREAFRLMARWLVRATFGDIPQLRQRKIVDQNRRIGVGFFGYHAWLALHGIRYSDAPKDQWVINTLKEMKQVVVESATKLANQLGIPVPVKFTTLAPTGTISTLPGTTGSGQSMMAPWFKRLVRYSDMDKRLDGLRAEGIRVFPDDDAKNTSIAEFWCEDPLVAKVRALGFVPEEVLESQYDVSMETSLATQAMLQEHYADNAISFTINLRPEDMPPEEEMERLLMEYLPRIKGTTVFPEKSRKNSPIQPLTKEQFDAHLGPKQVTAIEVECVGGCPVK